MSRNPKQYLTELDKALEALKDIFEVIKIQSSLNEDVLKHLKAQSKELETISSMVDSLDSERVNRQ